MSHRPHLHALAEYVGLLPGYHDVSGSWRAIQEETAVQLLAALGLSAEGEAAAKGSLHALESREAGRLIPPTQAVVRPDLPTWKISRQAVQTIGPVQGWRLEVDLEQGESLNGEGRWSEARSHSATGMAITWRELSIGEPPPGCHTVRIRLRSGIGGDDERVAVQHLIVAPPMCFDPLVTTNKRALGLWCHLYAVRGRGWGIGDFADLAALARALGELGLDFVGLNPLHALRNRPGHVAPYYPESRLFLNPLYIRLSAMPEWNVFLGEPRASVRADAPFAAAPPPGMTLSAGFCNDLNRRIEELRRASHVPYESISNLQRPLLRELYRIFNQKTRAAHPDRFAAFERFIQKGGRLLKRFALFKALQEHIEQGNGRFVSWRQWPSALRRPDGEAVTAFENTHPDAWRLHAFIQFEADRQHRAAAETARNSGMRFGLYHDLALGSAGDGADTWLFPEEFVEGVEVGAPPDPYCERGQAWGFPPLNPMRMAETGYGYWRALLQANLRHAAMLRIDHVMGLFRQFWIPAGAPPAHGAYVRFPAKELLAVLALESTRHEAMIIGEDLGTVEDHVRHDLDLRAIYGSSVLFFEREPDGGFRPSRDYRPRGIVSVGTHDMPPFAGLREGADIAIREQAGWQDEAASRGQKEERRETFRRLLQRLIAEGCLPSDQPPDSAPSAMSPRSGEASDEPALFAAHRFIARTPARIVALALDDLAAETAPLNMPGMTHADYPSWTRRNTLPWRDIVADPRIIEHLRELIRRVHGAQHDG